MPENISIDNSGNSIVLTNVAQHTIPFFLSFIINEYILFTLTNGITANNIMMPSVDLGKSKSKGVAYRSVSMTIKVVVTDDIALYEPTDSFTADLENEPDTGYAPDTLDAMLPKPCPNNS